MRFSRKRTPPIFNKMAIKENSDRNKKNPRQTYPKGLKEAADKLMKIRGNVRGEAIRVDFLYILAKKGKQGLAAVEEKIAELGYPLKLKEIRRMDWYPEAQSVLVTLTAKEVFNWTEADIFKMGNSTPKFSFIMKMLMKYMISPKKIFETTPVFWEEHFDFGKLECVEFNDKEKYSILRLREYKMHSIMCQYLAGYFLRVAQLCIKSGKISIKETKCVFKGHPYEEYVLKWD